MTPFRFRAQAAIELRRRAHDDARAALARIEAELRRSEESQQRARDAAADATRAATEDLRRDPHSPAQSWHRTWMFGKQRDCAAAARAVMTRQRERDTARAAWLVARQRLESLERLRDKAWRQWQAQAAAEEQKQYDAIATMRHAAGKGERT
jgi:flagellar export protein FliJ